MEFILSVSFLCLVVILAVVVSAKATTYFLRTKEDFNRRFDDVWRNMDSLNRLLDDKEASLFRTIDEHEKALYRRIEEVEREHHNRIVNVQQELIKEIGSVARTTKK